MALILHLLTSQAARKHGKTSPPRKRKQAAVSDSLSSDDDIPLASSPAKPAKSVTRKANGKGGPSKSRTANGKPPKKKVKQDTDASESSDDDDKALVVKKPNGNGKARQPKGQSSVNDSSDDDKPISKKPDIKNRVKAVKEEPASGAQKTRKRNKVKKEEEATSPAKGKRKKKEEEEEEEEVFKWWEQNPDNDGSVKWNVLEHSGVLFPPPYEPLPSHIKMKYNGMSRDIFHIFEPSNTI